MRAERWYSQALPFCVCCRRNWGLVLHHVTYEQHVRNFGGDVDDPDNSLTLCNDCHAVHHDGSGRKIPATLLSDNNVRFMVALMGMHRAAAYVRRHYRIPEARSNVAA